MSYERQTLRDVIEQVAQEKGIETRVLVDAVEQAILTAAKRTFGAGRELEARLNEETGWVDLFLYMKVVEEVEDPEREISVEDAAAYELEAEPGEELGFQIFYRDEDAEAAREQQEAYGELLHLEKGRQRFGRIAAQTAKQVILQRVRNAERDRIYEEFKDRIGELISGTVRRFERGSNIIVDVGDGIEAILPHREQTPRESYRPGDRIVALLKNIDREARGPMLILSRADVGLLVKLFELEVPEIYEGIVRIVAAAREPGARSKVAVSSRQPDVDPVGACVGMKGSRVQAVVQELRGEKIDIVPWDRDPARFVCNAIAPAEVVRVVIDEANQTMQLVVPDAKLSLAIGRRGQNVRLASQLTGWKLDIVSESRFKQLEEEAMRQLRLVDDGDGRIAKALYRMGFRGIDEVAEAPDEELAAIEEIGEERLEEVRQRALQALEALRQERMGEAAARVVAGQRVPDRERLTLVQGISERLAEQLDAGGYSAPEAIVQEEDPDRLALRTGLPLQQAGPVQQAARRFLEEEWPKALEIARIERTQLEAAAAEAAAEQGAAEPTQAAGDAKSPAAEVELATAGAEAEGASSEARPGQEG